MDTLQGIAEWWLLRQRVRMVVRQVERVLLRLTAEGALERSAPARRGATASAAATAGPRTESRIHGKSNQLPRAVGADALFSFVQALRRWMTRRLRRPAAVRPYRRPALEAMEDRLVLSGQPSLRGRPVPVRVPPLPATTAVPAYVQGLDQGGFTGFQAARVRQTAGGRAGRGPGRLSAVLAPPGRPAGPVLGVSFLLGGGSRRRWTRT